MYGKEREMLACPSCGNNKGNRLYKRTRTTDEKITYHRRCKECNRRFNTYHTRIDPYEILDKIKCKADELRRDE